ncbi:MULTISPECIES: DMT family transporter [unclassified Chryseobacterium]|uniref:DMT family transporter n=1 Tax=unclassified Chryseobacterium TaxID=2593645 RepID=UPI00226A4FCB|nr:MULTISPECIES: DMT family transporter [unclassified Chryseobacterium]
MKNEIAYLILALFTGTLIPVQAAANSAFTKSVGHPFINALMIFTVGFAGMLIFFLLSRTAFPSSQQLLSAILAGIQVDHYSFLCHNDNDLNTEIGCRNFNRPYCNRSDIMCSAN